MTDREKVIQNLQDAVNDDWMWEHADYYARTMEKAIQLLKEQEAVKPKKENDGNPEPCTSWWYVCGDCGRYIDPHDRFCRHCGREVDWLEEEQHGQD